MANQTTVTAVPNKQELFIVREFDAPRELVFKAFNDPELLLRWMGPNDMEIEKLDNRSGGSYRFIHCDTKGNEYAFNGAIHEVHFPERMIRTFEFEGLPERGHVSLEFLSLEVLETHKTKVTIQSIFRSVADRDGLVMSGMERGVSDGFIKMDTLLKTII